MLRKIVLQCVDYVEVMYSRTLDQLGVGHNLRSDTEKRFRNTLLAIARVTGFFDAKCEYCTENDQQYVSRQRRNSPPRVGIGRANFLDDRLGHRNPMDLEGGGLPNEWRCAAALQIGAVAGGHRKTESWLSPAARDRFPNCAVSTNAG